MIFSGGKAHEGMYHYNLDAYLSSFLEFLGGRVFPEVPEGGGRVDILVLQGQKRWIIEVKRFLGPDLLEQWTGRNCAGGFCRWRSGRRRWDDGHYLHNRLGFAHIPQGLQCCIAIKNPEFAVIQRNNADGITFFTHTG